MIAAMSCSAVRNPKDRWLMDLILFVHSLNGAAGDAVLWSMPEIPVEVSAERPHEFLEGLQPRTHGRSHPFLQVFPPPAWAACNPRRVGRLF
jgi:hypothetical protein